MPEFLRQCWQTIPDVSSAEGREKCKGIAYVMSALKLYTAAKTVFSNPLRGGLRPAADRLSLQVMPYHFVSHTVRRYHPDLRSDVYAYAV